MCKSWCFSTFFKLLSFYNGKFITCWIEFWLSEYGKCKTEEKPKTLRFITFLLLGKNNKDEFKAVLGWGTVWGRLYLSL